MKPSRLTDQETWFSAVEGRFVAAEAKEILMSSPCLIFSNHSARRNLRKYSDNPSKFRLFPTVSDGQVVYRTVYIDQKETFHLFQMLVSFLNYFWPQVDLTVSNSA